MKVRRAKCCLTNDTMNFHLYIAIHFVKYHFIVASSVHRYGGQQKFMVLYVTISVLCSVKSKSFTFTVAVSTLQRWWRRVSYFFWARSGGSRSWKLRLPRWLRDARMERLFSLIWPAPCVSGAIRGPGKALGKRSLISPTFEALVRGKKSERGEGVT